MILYGLLFLFGCVFLTVVITARLVPVLQNHHVGQRILEIGPKWHMSKQGTPTMGGLSFLAVALPAGIVGIAALWHLGEDLRPFALLLCFALANGAVGTVDDAAKMRKRQNEGLLPWQKLFLQTVFAVAFLALYRLYGGGTEVRMLFSGYTVQLGIFFYPLAALYLIGSINFVNLTDGIDGLASAVTTTCGMFFFLCGIAYGNPALQSGGALLAGCSLGFLFFNAHPAKVFMGDTGSLFLGALAVGCAFLSPTPLSLLPAGIVYYLEGASVILQVAVFKLTHRRLFRMAPLHHHFEKSGWSEWRVVLFFLTLSLLGDAVAFFSLPA